MTAPDTGTDVEGGSDDTWIAGTFTSDVGWDLLEAFVDVGDRMAGSEGERAGAEATRDALAGFARDARLEALDLHGWVRGESAVRADGSTHDCVALPRSPPGEATAEFVDLGYGLPEDFDTDLEEKVVMAFLGSWAGVFHVCDLRVAYFPEPVTHVVTTPCGPGAPRVIDFVDADYSVVARGASKRN